MRNSNKRFDLAIVPKYFGASWGGLQNFTNRLNKKLCNLGVNTTILSPRHEGQDPNKFWLNLPERLKDLGGVRVLLAIGLEYDENVALQIKCLSHLERFEDTRAWLRIATTGDLTQRANLIPNDALHSISGLIVLNRAMLSEAHSLLDQDRAYLIPVGVDTERFAPVTLENRAVLRQRFGLPDEATIVIAPTRDEDRKRIEVLLEAKRITQTNVLLWLVGPGGNSGRMTNLVNSRGILVSPPIPETEIHMAYQCSDIFVTASEREGMSNAVVEAASSGLPVCAPAIPGILEICEAFNNQGFILVNENSPQALAEALRIVQRGSPRKMRQLREPGLQRFDISEVAMSYVRLLDLTSTAMRYVRS
ncbi:glycosyltransferase family 4 protein [Thiorhodococcus mannitoliphagus]|uniref:Glycosyltransferase family 4 protein n=1 Tax=Thiorhodococcus mannitoliphagus TaxID=329406 RepID=A0A6P1DSF6_9GAMM|nr:glycosyltransferase family 4 protein [Thiorhodococcus mannitoliphagus]NEX21217.1 glycosyltransferase family 4 protein [Thiorhodococcus mannitoliphagus]